MIGPLFVVHAGHENGFATWSSAAGRNLLAVLSWTFFTGA